MGKLEMASKNPDHMTEEELARFYEEHSGDVSLWEKKPRQMRVRRGGPSTVFTLRLAPEEMEELFAAAKTEGETLSDFLRKAALERAKGIQRRRTKAI
jgi:hypothetical protein